MLETQDLINVYDIHRKHDNKIANMITNKAKFNKNIFKRIARNSKKKAFSGFWNHQTIFITTKCETFRKQEQLSFDRVCEINKGSHQCISVKPCDVSM